jgi:hypothetical protein
MADQPITQHNDPFEADFSSASSTPAAADGAGSGSPAELARRGIVRVSVDQFEVGGYRYTSLKDAIAQSDREPATPSHSS